MCDITQRSRRIFFVAAESTMIRIYTYLIQKKLFILIVQFACVVNIVIIIGIFSLIELNHFFSTPAAPGRHPIPRDRATAPRRKNGRRSQTLGERRFFKGALSQTASNRYIFCWLNGRALDSGQTDRQLNLPVSCVFASFFCCSTAVLLLYKHGGIVGC